MTPSIVKWQIVAPDAKASADFYNALFGWAVRADNALGYREVHSAGVGGGVWPAPPGVSPFVQLFVAVPDVDAAVARATDLGASVVVPKAVLPDGDVMAVLRDPTGVTFGLCLQR